MSFDATGPNSKVVIEDFNVWGLCSSYIPPDEQNTKFVWVQNDNSQVTDGCPTNVSDDKPIFIFMQYALHCRFRMDSCVSFLDNIMVDFARRFYHCYDRIRFLYSGGTSSTNDLVQKYPHQSDEKVIQFNSDIKNWFNKKYPFVLVLDFFNLTWESHNHTSDGFHHLSDVNLIKAMTLLNSMHFLALQTKYIVNNVSIYFPTIDFHARTSRKNEMTKPASHKKKKGGN